MRILASSGRLNRSGSICPNSIKKSKFRPPRACCAIWEWIKQLLQNSFNLKTRVFQKENVVIRISYPRNNEELQQFKKFSDDISYIVIEFNEPFISVKGDSDIKRKVKILKGQKALTT